MKSKTRRETRRRRTFCGHRVSQSPQPLGRLLRPRLLPQNPLQDYVERAAHGTLIPNLPSRILMPWPPCLLRRRRWLPVFSIPLNNSKCQFGDNCRFTHLDPTGKEIPKPTAVAKSKGQAKNKLRKYNSPRRLDTMIAAHKLAVPCQFCGTDAGCVKGDQCEFGH